MIVGQAIYAALTGNTTVNTLIAGRCWPDPAPQTNTSYPRVVYLADDAAGNDAFDGPAGIYEQKVTLSCEALDYTSADALASAILKYFDGLRGTFGGVSVQGIFFETDRDKQYTLENTTTLGLIYASELDFTIVWNN
jgi:hypothetical protein